MRRAVAEQEAERPMRRAVAEQEAERPMHRAVAEQEAERPMRQAVAVPSCQLVPLHQVDSKFQLSLVVPDAANLAVQLYQLLPPSFFRYCGKGKQLLPG
jgi:hypothetical protein